MEKKTYEMYELREFLELAKAEVFRKLEQRCMKKADLKTCDHGEIVFSNDKFYLQEKYCLGELFSGQEMVTYHKRPIWMLNYMGQTRDNTWEMSCELILELLKLVLIAAYKSDGLCGWIYREKDGYEVSVHNRGKGTWYSGKGYIHKDGKVLFQYTYYGGVVSD